MTADWFAAHPWAAIAVILAAFLLLVAVVLALHRFARTPPELTRKLLHTGSGLLTLSFPLLFAELWPVLLLCAAAALLVAAFKLLPAVRRHGGAAIDGVNRATFGELYFPISVAVVFGLSLGQPALLFVIPILVLTVADATCALVGLRYGLIHFEGAAKSLEGSVAFVVVAFLCIHVSLLVWSPVGRVESLLMAATMALIVMLLEASAWRGLDNLFIPIGGFFLLRAYLPMTVAELGARLLVTLALLAVVLAVRRRSTLLDDSLVAGAFLCYLTWALAGWRWLVPPAMLLLTYAWISPRTPDNSRRMHQIGAMLAVWAPALVWLGLARRLDAPDLLYPFAMVFACHLGIFGMSRLAHDYRRRPLRPIIAAATVKSAAFVLVPYAGLEGFTARSVLLAVVSIAGIAAAAAGFAAGEPDIRDASLQRSRWLRQGLSAAGGSLIGWLMLAALDRLAPGIDA